MAYKDLREFIRTLQRHDQIKWVRTPVDPVLEMAEINDRVVKSGGPALYFEHPVGSDIPVAVNLFGSMRRMNMALEVDNLDDIGRGMMEFLEPDIPSGIIGKLKALPKLRRLSSFLPAMVRTGPCKERVLIKDASLGLLPVLKTWPLDGGRFITLPLVFTRDPDTGMRNCGMYRMQVYDDLTTGMHWHMHKDGASHFGKAEARGERLPVAVAIGSDPAVMYSATAPLPPDIDEMLLAGFLRGAPVEMVRCETVPLEVPANAEIVLEGYVEPGERRVEGPFGDHTGYYSLDDRFPVFHLTAMTMRRDPIYTATVVGKPPQEDAYLGKATERIFLPLIRKTLPEVVDMNMPIEGVFHNIVLASIKKKYPGHARKVMHALWGMGQMAFAKMIIVLDAEVDVQDLAEVAWRVGNNVDPARDVEITRGPADVLEHASDIPAYGGKMGIDATRKLPSEGFTRRWPPEIVMPDEIKSMVTKRWRTYGID